MSTVLVTGASGFIGRALCSALADRHEVLALSRRDPGLGIPWIRGEFSSFEDLRQLDAHQVDAVCHLAAVTGGCLERDGILVNVEGTRCLMRYLMDRGCRQFVMASSIAAVGMQSPLFRPVRLPIPDDHPCLDRDGYGLSKALMEEITRYYARQNPGIRVVNLRLASISPDETPYPLVRPGTLAPWALGGLSVMMRSDAVRALMAALESDLAPGVYTFNCTHRRAWAAVPTAEVLRSWWGDDVDLSHFEGAGHAWDSAYDVSAIQRMLGFVAAAGPGHAWPEEYPGPS